MVSNIIKKNEKVQAGDHELNILKETFPQCFDKEGRFNKEAFLSALPDGFEVTDETSGFNWLGKNYARMLYNMDSTTVICPDKEHNALPENSNSQNVYISGDNLDALQHLVKSYSGQVKVIYIDPPYNTGSDDFVYNDKFNFTAEELAGKLGVTTERAERILSMTRRGSASHAAWLTFMLPRLSFARDLLAKDGVIFISIDDNEQANLKCLCDEVFGESNFLACIIWQHSIQPKGYLDTFSVHHNYLLAYCKSESYDLVPLKRTEANNTAYSNPDNDPKGPWRSGDVRNSLYRKNLIYDIISPSGKVIKPCANGWRWSKETVDEKIKTGEIIFSKDETRIIRKIYLSSLEGRAPETIWFGKDCGTSRSAVAELKELFDGGTPFETPKPTELIRRVIEFCDDPDAIILDFFGGSSTTAHAVLQKNAEDSGNRKFILVQLPEECKPDSEANKAGYRTIDQIGMERIKRAAAKIREENSLFSGDLGFKHFTLKEAPQDTLDKLEKFDKNHQFGAATILDKFGADTVLRTWLVADGYGLTADAEPLILGNYEAYYYDKHLYLINPEENFDEESLAALIDLYQGTTFSPQNVVVFGYSFGAARRVELDSNLRSLNSGNKSLQITIDVRY